MPKKLSDYPSPPKVLLQVDDKDERDEHSEFFNFFEAKAFANNTVMKFEISDTGEREGFAQYYFRKDNPKHVEAIKKLIAGLQEWVK